jgi:hypothetical protein
LKFEDLMADLAAYLVSEYDIEPRDAAGLVMNSPHTQALYSSEEPITEQRVKALIEEFEHQVLQDSQPPHLTSNSLNP